MAEEKKSFYSDVSELTFPSLIYPNDMSANNFYPDCVCFTIQKRIGVSINDMTTALGAGVKAHNTAWAGHTDTKTGKIPESLQRAISKVLNKEKATEQNKQVGIQEAISAYKKEKPDHNLPDNFFEVVKESVKAFGASMQGAQQKALQVGKDGTNILGSIYLNMPNGIQFNEAANWGGQELGFMGKATQDLVSGQGGLGTTAVGALAGSAGSLIGASVGAIPSLVSKLGISGGMFGAAIGAMAAGGPIQRGAESALGVAQNPYMEMMFSGVGFRKFQFEFILRPKSSDEVNEVAEILSTLRTFTKPTFTEGALGKSFMDYPMEFKIEFLTSGEKADQGAASRRDGMKYTINPHIPRLKDCVCDNITSNFTPQSIWAAHDEGAPVAVNLSLSFQETELVMAEDVYHKEY